MRLFTRSKSKYYFGNKITCPISEEEYNLFKEIRAEVNPIPSRGFITFGSDFVFDADVEEGEPTPLIDLVKEFEARCVVVKKELQAIKNQKLKMK